MKHSTIQYRNAEMDTEIQQILDLQQQNLSSAISRQEAIEQGFLSVKHDFDLLKEMNEQEPHVIAVDGQAVVGYALAMPKIFKSRIPILKPLFEKIDQLHYAGHLLKQKNYIIMGQVCVAKSHRGQGVFDGLYQQFRQQMQHQFDFIITEVATRNKRSRRAHQRIGFKDLELYQAPNGEEWAIVIWD